MDWRGSRVTVLAWHDRAGTIPIAKALARLGCEALSCTADEFLAPSREDLPQPGAVVLITGSRSPPDGVGRVVSAASPIPCIAAISDEVGSDAEAVARQCFDFLDWPCRDSELRLRLERALVPMEQPVFRRHDAEVLERFAKLELIGESEAFLRCLRLLARLARRDAPVLIHGETGTGKELAARALHYLGNRRDQPFVPVNCGAIPDNLLENELFGHVRGAYTDARESQAGLIAQAHGGTLFLDEIDALTARAQVTLLRFLQDQEYTPLGGGSARRANVRVVAASNASLEAKTERGEFRPDLLFRLDIVSLELPPLRARQGDVELLAEHFLRRFSRQYHEPPKALHMLTRQWMRSYTWPGNVRELESFVLRCVLLCDGPVICTQGRPDVAETIYPDRGSHERVDFTTAKARAVSDFERDYLCELMDETRGNVTAAARLAGKERRALGRLLKKHGIRRLDYARHG